MAARKLADLPAWARVFVIPCHPKGSDSIPCKMPFLPIQVQIGQERDTCDIGCATLLQWRDYPLPFPWIVENVGAKGWGPLFYDICMELATLTGRGLTACGGSTNLAAEAIWNYYWYHRQPEIQVERLLPEFLAGRKSDPLQHVYRKQPSVLLDALADRTEYITEPIRIL